MDRDETLMVRMGNVWDRAVEVLRGRSSILGSIALGTIFVPTLVGNAVSAFAAPASGSPATPATGGLGAVVALAILLAGVWGQLAMLAVSSDPATTRADAGRQATQRLLPALGIVLLLGVVFTLAFMPLIFFLMRAGVNFTSPNAMQSVSASTAGSASLYILVLMVLGLVVGARLLLLNAVIVNERRGIGAILRSVRLTKGMTLRIIGLMLLFGLVLLVPMLAVQSVVGLVARLVLGGDAPGLVAFLASAAGAVVTTVFSVVAAAFTAQLYVAAVADKDGASIGI